MMAWLLALYPFRKTKKAVALCIIHIRKGTGFRHKAAAFFYACSLTYLAGVFHAEFSCGRGEAQRFPKIHISGILGRCLFRYGFFAEKPESVLRQAGKDDGGEGLF